MEIVNITPKYIDEVLSLQKEVYDNLEDKEVLETLGREDMLTLLESEYRVGVFDGEELKALRAFYIPKIDEDEHLADDANVSREDTIYSEITFIHEDLRGKNLQLKMGEILLEKLRKDKQFKYLIGTVMPTNLPSLKNTMSLGLNVVNTKIKYGNKRRHILMLDLENEQTLSGDPIKIKYDDFDWMLENGKDYLGVELKDDYITYYKK